MSERETEQPVAVLVGMIEAMLKRSEKYRREAEADGDLNDGEKHARVSSVLKELARLGKGLGAAAGDSDKAPLADRTAFVSSDWLDLLAVGWEAEAELLEGRLAHDPFRKRPENISCEEGERMRVEINRLRVCALELREWLVGLASKSND